MAQFYVDLAAHLQTSLEICKRTEETENDSVKQKQISTDSIRR